jgi:hypothetical protein
MQLSKRISGLCLRKETKGKSNNKKADYSVGTGNRGKQQGEELKTESV